MSVPSVNSARRNLSLLSIDAGGIYGISALLVIQALMIKIQERSGLETPPKPCEIFDLAGGTGTGGLLVILLFRLNMTADQAIQTYRRLSERVFCNRNRWHSVWPRQAEFSASQLEAAVNEIVMSVGGLTKTQAKMALMTNESGWKCLVCARPDKSTSPTFFRSWESNENPISTVVRATMVHPVLFKPLKVKSSSGMHFYTSGGLGCSNSTPYVLQEATSQFPSQHVSCIVSLGNANGIVKSSAIPASVADAVKNIVEESENTSEAISRRFSFMVDFFFRFNAPINDDLEWKHFEEIKGEVTKYLNLPNIAIAMTSLAQKLVERPAAVLSNDLQNPPSRDHASKQTIERQPFGHQQAEPKEADRNLEKSPEQLLDSSRERIGNNAETSPQEAQHELTRGAGRETSFQSRASKPPQRPQKQKQSMGAQENSNARVVSQKPKERKYILCIDGSGIRGLGCLTILGHLMTELSYENPMITRPCQVFDLICGTSTGGLVAILLGRLGLDCETAKRVYCELVEALYKNQPDNLPNPSFEERLAIIVEKYAGSKDASLKLKLNSDTILDTSNPAGTNTFVTTINPNAASVNPYHIRSYTDPGGSVEAVQGHDWTICEAVLAAIASPPYLHPVTVQSLSFQDAGATMSANPVLNAISELDVLWPKDEPVVICLGTGLASFVLSDLNSDSEDDADEFTDQLDRVARDTHVRHREASRQLRKLNLDCNYVRLDPTGGLGDINMFDITKFHLVESLTIVWLRRPEGEKKIYQAYQALKKKKLS